MPSLPETPARFLASAITHDGEACLEWPFSKSGGGYGKVGRSGKTFDVHRLICRAVHGDPPGPRYDAAHSCGKRACCNPAHLRWDTRKGNFSDKKKHGTLLSGERHGMAKLTTAQISEIRTLKGKMLHREIGAQFNISGLHVGKILREDIWANV